MSLEDCRRALPIWSLWGRLGLADAEKVARGPGASGECKICSPFREDNNPSFSIFERDGVGFWKDHGTDDSGDEVKLIEAARGLSTKEAIALYHELAGVEMRPAGGGRKPTAKGTKGAKKVEGGLGSGGSGSAGLGAGGGSGESEGERKMTAAEKRLGVEPGAKAPERKKAERPKGGAREIVAVYEYQDAHGAPAHETIRFEPKDFRQRRRALPSDEPGRVKDGWVWSLKDTPVFPYRLPELLAFDRREPVFLVEGEKDVENLERVGELCATTLPMGAGKWREEFSEWFQGRWVIVVVDDDFAGRKGAAKVADALLDGVAERVGILEISDLWKDAPDGADLSDWLEWGWEFGVTVEEQREELWKAAEGCEVVPEDPYERVLVKGQRGVTIAEDRMVRALMKLERLIFVGDKFWRYKRGIGKWEPLVDKSWVPRRIRGILAGLPGTESLITSARVSSIEKLAKTERVKAPEDLNDRPAGMLACRNGLLEVETGRLFPHREGYLTTVQTPHDFDPGATCPEWLKWLGERQDDEETIAQIQEMFGYCLMTDINFHSFFFIYGDGGTGKSTCVDVLEKLVGVDNRVSIELTELDNPFLRSRLVGKSLYLAKELTSRSFQHIGLIKAMVSGDPISVDVKYGEGFEFRPKGRLVMESNVQAMTPDSSAGFERRFIQIGFDKKVDRATIDFSFGERFDAEMPGILNWALEGYRRLKERGRFQHTARSQKASDDIKMHRAQVESFLRTARIFEADEVKVEVGGPDYMYCWISGLFELYEDWCDDNAVVPWFKDVRSFKRELFTNRPEWRDRQKRARREGERDYLLEGLVMEQPQVEY